MKQLTREDIQKYGTEEEKKLLESYILKDYTTIGEVLDDLKMIEEKVREKLVNIKTKDKKDTWKGGWTGFHYDLNKIIREWEDYREQ